MKANEFFSTTGENLLKKVKELIEEGNVRRITITEKSGKELMSFPLTIGVVGAVLAPLVGCGCPTLAPPAWTRQRGDAAREPL